MQYYFLDPNPRANAESFLTSDLKDMLAATQQIIVNAALQSQKTIPIDRTADGRFPHVVAWVLDSRSNWRHISNCLYALNYECLYRDIDRPEGTETLLKFAKDFTPYNTPELGFTEFPKNVEPKYIKFSRDALTLHRLSYIDSRDDVSADDWQPRPIPEWYVNMLDVLVSGKQQIIKNQKKK